MLIGPLTNSNYNKNKSHNDNCDISKVGNEMTWIKEILQTDSNYIKSKIYDDIYKKNNYNINDKVGI